jgi:hypothetical protein
MRSECRAVEKAGGKPTVEEIFEKPKMPSTPAAQRNCWETASSGLN